MIAWKRIPWTAAVVLILAGGHQACSRPETQNSLSQSTGAAGSTAPKSQSPYYPNTAGNIVAPPGNPGGNASGSPPIVGGTANQQPVWPEGR